MQLWIAFLALSFAAGSRAAATGRREHVAMTVLGCVFVAMLFTLQRFA